MKKACCFILLLLFTNSCQKHAILSLVKPLYNNPNKVDFYYQGESNYKNFYIVDTIKINNPILFYYQRGRFVTCADTLFKQKKITEKFLKRPDVFVFSWNLRSDFDLSQLKRYKYKDYGKCDVKKQISNYKGVELYRFTCDSVKFILGMINVNYFNSAHVSADGSYWIKQTDQKILYYKIVYPLCE